MNEASLRQEIHEKDRVIVAAAQALRSPLTTILGFAEVLRRPDSARLAGEERDDALDAIASSGRRIAMLVDNILDLERARAGRFLVHRSRADLSEVVASVVDRLDLGGRHPLQVAVDPSAALIDEFLVRRILENLLVNAVRFTPPGTPVRLDVRRIGSDVELVVADEGPGVPNELRDILFDRFRHTDGPYTGPGAGFGLYLVQRLAELHGGKAWLAPSPVGAEFHVFLAAEPVIDLTEPDPPAAIGPAGDMVPVGFLLVDPGGRALQVNQAWADLSRLSREDALGSGWMQVLSIPDRQRLLAQIGAVADEGRVAPTDYQITAGSTRCWTRWWLRSHAGAHAGLVGVAVADVEVDHAREAELRHFATHDPLTGLFNRTQFFEFAEQAIRRLGRTGGQVGVVFVDLDGFKAVNDNGGHSLGDRVLIVVAERLRRAVRPSDVVARVGGDEFVVLCEELDEFGCTRAVAERIVSEFAEMTGLAELPWQVGVTVGVATTCGPDDTVEDLLDRADRAMYEARSAQRTA